MAIIIIIKSGCTIFQLNWYSILAIFMTTHIYVCLFWFFLWLFLLILPTQSKKPTRPDCILQNYECVGYHPLMFFNESWCWGFELFGFAFVDLIVNAFFANYSWNFTMAYNILIETAFHLTATNDFVWPYA